MNYVNYIKDNWEEFREYKKDSENAKDWWDAAKHMVRSLSVVYSIQKKTDRKGAKEGSYERKRKY